MYDQQLQLLESLTQPNVVESNFNQNSDNEEVDTNFNDEDDTEEVNFTSDGDHWARKKKSPSIVKKQKNHFEEKFHSTIRETTKIEDEDRSFFESLLPTVRLLDPNQKLLFRSRVLTFLMEIKNPSRQTSNYSSMYHTSSTYKP